MALKQNVYEATGIPIDKRLGNRPLVFQFTSLKAAKDVYYNLLNPKENRQLQKITKTTKLLFSSWKGVPHIDNGKLIKPAKSL